MTAAVDKVVIANRSGMAQKYGAAGLATISAALARLVMADAARHIVTKVVHIDDVGEMKDVGGSPIINAADERGAKAAVDAVHNAYGPDYMLLLDGPDVIPHIALDAPSGITDGDVVIESDLPYASPARFSRAAGAFLAVTRVVGRLPMTRGVGNAEGFAAMIDRCTRHEVLSSTDGLDYFAISASVWDQSSRLSLNAVFGHHKPLQICPTAGHAAIDPMLRARVHFINCHGAPIDHRFYGDDASPPPLPVAMDGGLMAAHVQPGTLVVAECCYGAALYDPTLLPSPDPICISYLHGGALGFLGSTGIAYGPADRNGQADWICQYFLEAALQGASIGRAMLQARQKFVLRQSMSSPVNLKTLAQFVLYGDPSLLLTEAAPPIPGSSPADDDRTSFIAAADLASGRKLRRINLESDGNAVASSASVPGKVVTTVPASLDRVKAHALQRGYTGDPVVLGVRGGSRYQQASKRSGQEAHVAVICEPKPASATSTDSPGIRSFRILTAHLLGDGITAIEECESR